MRILSWLLICLSLPAYAQEGDYSQIETLNWSDVPPVASDHYFVAATFADAANIQHYMRTGIKSPARSPQFMVSAAAGLSRKDDIYWGHGFSNPFIGWQVLETYGCSSASLCKPYTIRISSAAFADAASFKTGHAFLGFDSVPTYAACIQHLATNPGDVAILTTEGRESYAIIGVDPDGFGIWLDHNGAGQPVILHLNHEMGASEWESMLYRTDKPWRDPNLGPQNFIVVLGMP